MTIFLKLFGGYLGNVEKVLDSQYFLSFADCRVHNKIHALPKSLGSKIPFSRKRCWGNFGPTQLSWK